MEDLAAQLDGDVRAHPMSARVCRSGRCDVCDPGTESRVPRRHLKPVDQSATDSIRPRTASVKRRCFARVASWVLPSFACRASAAS